MNHKRPPIPAIIIILLILATSAYFIITQAFGDKNGALTASGFIEATQINIAPELAGKVGEVLVSEGQTVRQGQSLIRLDSGLLKAQREVAAVGLELAKQAQGTAEYAYDMAQAQYDAAVIAARMQEGSERLTDWTSRAPGEFDQPLWYFSQEEQIAAAQDEVLSASEGLVKAQSDLEVVLADVSNADFVEAEQRLGMARIGYLIARAVFDHAQVTGGKVSPSDVKMPPHFATYRTMIEIAKLMSGTSEIIDAAQVVLDEAKLELDEAQQAYDDLLDTQAADEVLQARAAISVAYERYQVAQDILTSLKTGEYSPQVSIAAAGLEQARSALAVAESAYRQAAASLDLLDTQIQKLTITAPVDGVILTRNVEMGEFVQPGSTSLVLGQLDHLTITVYVPEDRIGEIQIGQSATVSVDSFPGMTFTATVIQIADQAEFTPRNVQTVEGRSSTVFAIQLSVDNAEGKLKIGMPADVVFVTVESK